MFSKAPPFGIQVPAPMSWTQTLQYFENLIIPTKPLQNRGEIENPKPLRVPTDDVTEWDWLAGAPCRVRTYMYIKSFPTKPLGNSGDLQSCMIFSDDTSQVLFGLDGKGCGGSGRKESTKSLVKRCGKLIKSDLICDDDDPRWPVGSSSQGCQVPCVCR